MFEYSSQVKDVLQNEEPATQYKINKLIKLIVTCDISKQRLWVQKLINRRHELGAMKYELSSEGINMIRSQGTLR